VDLSVIVEMITQEKIVTQVSMKSQKQLICWLDNVRKGKFIEIYIIADRVENKSMNHYVIGMEASLLIQRSIITDRHLESCFQHEEQTHGRKA